MIKRLLVIMTAMSCALGGAKIATIPKCDNNKPEAIPIPYIQYDGGAVYVLSQNEYDLICRVVMGESGGEPYVGQQAIAQCIRNTCYLTHQRPDEVIRNYHYTIWRPEPSESVKKAVLSVFTDGESVFSEKITMFYAPDLMPKHWSADHENEIYACTIGGHKFFIERKFASV